MRKSIDINKTQASQIIAKLHEMHPYRGNAAETPTEQWSAKIANWMLIISVVLMAILGAFALWHNYVQLLDGTGKEIAIILSCIALILPMLSILLNIASGIWILVKLQKKSISYFINEIDNDELHVSELLVFPKKDLENAKRILQFKITRIKNRIGMFFGAPDKVALISLAAMGWSFFKELNSKNAPSEVLNVMHIGATLNNLLQYVAAFFAGLAIGAILLNRQMQRHIYQSELLEMAISRKEEIENS